MDVFDKSKKNKIKWACRRGMLELDLVLSHFLETTYDHLTSAQQKNFETLLMSSDPELENWLLKKHPVSCVDTDSIEIIEIIKKTLINS